MISNFISITGSPHRVVSGKKKSYSPKLEVAITRAFNLWLSSLRANKKLIDDLQKTHPNRSLPRTLQPIPHVVSEFKLQQHPVRKVTAHANNKSYTQYLVDTAVDFADVKKMIEKFNKTEGENARREVYQELMRMLLERSARKPDATIVFYCKAGSPYMHPLTRNIHLYHRPQHKPENHLIPGTAFPFAELLHEIGHTFGLDDTYVEVSNAGSRAILHPRGHLKSTGVSEYTIGKQVVSIMGGYPLLNLQFPRYEDIAPTRDDYLGVDMMYSYVTGAIDSLAECPFEYEVEHFPKDAAGKNSLACRPKHPLLYAIKYKQWGVLETIINSPKYRLDVDINAQDGRGNTALHYSVIYVQHLLVKLLLAVYHKTISTTIKNNQGKTARDIAAAKGYQDIIKVVDWVDKKELSIDNSINAYFDLDQQVKRRQH